MTLILIFELYIFAIREVDKNPTQGYYGRRLTFDHRADDASEQLRVQRAGGFITRGRILGILAVSRSFGDHGMKDFVTAELVYSIIQRIS